MEKINDSIIIKSAETDEELCGRFAVYSPSRDEDLPDAGEVDAIYVLSEYYGCKKEWTLGTPVSIVRMIRKRDFRPYAGEAGA